MEVFDSVLNREAEETATTFQEEEKVQSFGEYEGSQKEAEFIPLSDIEEETGQAKEKEENKGAEYFADPEIGGEMMTNIFDLALSHLCSSISGNSAESHTMNRLQKKQLKSSIELYLKSSSPSGNLSPSKVLLLTIIIIVGMSLFKATKERKRNKKEAKQVSEVREKIKRGDYVDAEIKEEIEIKPFERNMGKFSLDSDGFYEYDERGTYIKQEDRKNKPSPFVLSLIRENKTGWEIKRAIKNN